LANLRSTAKDSAPKQVFTIFLFQKRSPTRAVDQSQGPMALPTDRLHFEILNLRQQAEALIQNI
jgi:hypothetical protein